MKIKYRSAMWYDETITLILKLFLNSKIISKF